MTSAPSSSAEAARAMAQAVLTARICHRFHTIGSMSSEMLKQRLHYLANADGSNLPALVQWNVQQPIDLTPKDPTISIDFDIFLAQMWTPDQLPDLTTAPVYSKALDQDLTQALVVIGRNQDCVVAVVLVLEEGPSPEGIQVKEWKYHDILALLHWDTYIAKGWSCVLNHKTSNPTSSASMLVDPQATMATVPSLYNSQGHDDNESDGMSDEDDDYWGQYGDAEDVSPGEENAKGPKKQEANVDNSSDDEDDDYWQTYNAEADPAKTRGSSSSNASSGGSFEQHAENGENELEHTSPTRVFADAPIDSQQLASTLQQPLTSLPGQVDANVLSSLLQMLVSQGVDQDQDAERPLKSPQYESDLEDNDQDEDNDIFEDSLTHVPPPQDDQHPHAHPQSDQAHTSNSDHALSATADSTTDATASSTQPPSLPSDTATPLEAIDVASTPSPALAPAPQTSQTSPPSTLVVESDLASSDISPFSVSSTTSSRLVTSLPTTSSNSSITSSAAEASVLSPPLSPKSTHTPPESSEAFEQVKTLVRSHIASSLQSLVKMAKEGGLSPAEMSALLAQAYEQQ